MPIAAPSANTFGHTSPTTAQHVLDDLNGRIDAVLDAGPCAIGLESTVLDPTQTPMVLYRPGAITAAQLTQATGIPVHIHQAAPTTAEPASLPSPGVGIRHYAPRARLILTGPTPQELNAALNLTTESSTGVILPTGWTLVTTNEPFIETWAPWDDIPALSARIFSALRSLDDRGATVMLCPLPNPTEHTAALRDRLQKAARPA
jgi:L-threonylcarbamoyladenylate synthase